MTPRRRKIVNALREQGRDAARQGQARESCPHKHMNRYQWLGGFDEIIRSLTPPAKDPERYYRTW